MKFLPCIMVARAGAKPHDEREHAVREDEIERLIETTHENPRCFVHLKGGGFAISALPLDESKARLA